MRGGDRLAGRRPLDGPVIRSPNAEGAGAEERRSNSKPSLPAGNQGRPRLAMLDGGCQRTDKGETPTGGNAFSGESRWAALRCWHGMPECCRQVAPLIFEWHGPHAHVLLARRITFDMRGQARLAGAGPLDGRVRPQTPTTLRCMHCLLRSQRAHSRRWPREWRRSATSHPQDHFDRRSYCCSSNLLD
jgi:hypothetical protein